jgi:hypothetical protein
LESFINHVAQTVDNNNSTNQNYWPSSISSPSSSTHSVASELVPASASSISLITSGQSSTSCDHISEEAQEIIDLVKRNSCTSEVPNPYSGPTMQWRMRVIRLLGNLLRNKS